MIESTKHSLSFPAKSLNFIDTVAVVFVWERFHVDVGEKGTHVPPELQAGELLTNISFASVEVRLSVTAWELVYCAPA
jgi:hypothetical protein